MKNFRVMIVAIALACVGGPALAKGVMKAETLLKKGGADEFLPGTGRTATFTKSAASRLMIQNPATPTTGTFVKYTGARHQTASGRISIQLQSGVYSVGGKTFVIRAMPAIQPMPPVIRQGPGGPYTPTAPTYFQQQR